MEERVVKVLKENKWSVATFGDMPNVVPVGFKDITEDGKLVIGDIMMDTTVKNIKATGKASVSAYNPETSEGYQVKGESCYLTEGPIFDGCKAKADAVFKGAVVVKGVVVIKPTQIIVTTPGAENKKELAL